MREGCSPTALRRVTGGSPVRLPISVTAFVAVPGRFRLSREREEDQPRLRQRWRMSSRGRSVYHCEMRVGLAVVLVVLAAGLGMSASAGTEAPLRARVGQAGVSLVIPAGWHSIPLVLPPADMNYDPVTRLVVSSGAIRFGRGCNDVDYWFPQSGVALVVLEWISPKLAGSLRPRPARFTASTLRVRPAPAIECFNGPGGSVQFKDHGRRFAAFLLVGKRAPARLADRARAVLDTLRVRA